MITRSIYLYAFVLLFVNPLVGQNTFSSQRQNDDLPRFTFQYSDNWEVDYESTSTIKLKIKDPENSQIGLTITVSGKIYKYDESGFSMEILALRLFSQKVTFDKIRIDGRKGFTTTEKNVFKKEDRIIKDYLVDFPQYSSISVHIAGSKVLFSKYEIEIENLLRSIKLQESTIPKPSVRIAYDEKVIDYSQYVKDSILNNLFWKREVIIGDTHTLSDLTDFFQWKRNGKEAMTPFKANNLLLYINWNEFTAIDISLVEDKLKIDFFINDQNLLTLNTKLEKPILISKIGRFELDNFYLDYRPQAVIWDNKLLFDENTNEFLKLPYMLINGEVFPINYKELIWN